VRWLGPGSGHRRQWACLLRYVWEVDVSTCPSRGAAMKCVEVATEPAAIGRVLAQLAVDGSEGHPPPRHQRMTKTPTARTAASNARPAASIHFDDDALTTAGGAASAALRPACAANTL
jgi:hypothetical protein